jgi:hypothetical protein
MSNHTDVLDVIKNIQNLYENNSSLGVLKDFERVLDVLDIYVYDNWIDGEIAYGPKVDRHWITVGVMWPESKMPDPDGGKRLTDLDCRVKYQRSKLLVPRSIKKPSDIRPGTKKGKLDHHPIWIVEIKMPKEVAFDIYRGYMDKMKNESHGTAAPKTGTPVAGAAPSPIVPSPAAAMPAPGQMPPGVAPTGAMP